MSCCVSECKVANTKEKKVCSGRRRRYAIFHPSHYCDSLKSGLDDPENRETRGESCTVASLRMRLKGFKYEHPAYSPLRTPSPEKQRLDSPGGYDHSSHASTEDDMLPVLSASQQSLSRKKSRKKPSRPYAPPEIYEHLHMLPDYLELELDREYFSSQTSGEQRRALLTTDPVVFCGIK